MRFDTILFDLDGTLVDSVADLATSVNLLRNELDLVPLPVATVRTYVGDGATMLVRRALGDDLYASEHLRRFLVIYGDHLLEETFIYPGILDFLRLHDGKPMGVVTNKPLALTLPLLDGLGLAPFFGAVVGGDGPCGKKPDPGPVLSALDTLGTSPEGALLIGDHHTDLKAGLAAKVRTCFCTWGLGNDGGISSDFVARTPFELPTLFPAESL